MKGVAKVAASIKRSSSVEVPEIGIVQIDEVFLAANDLDGMKRRGRTVINWVAGHIDDDEFCWPLFELARMIGA